MSEELFGRDTGALSGLLDGRAFVLLGILPQERTVSVSNKWDERADLCLYLGDAFELVRAVPDETVRLTVTSPPYNIGKEYERKLDLDEYVRWHIEIIKEACRVTKTGGSVCWQVGTGSRTAVSSP